MTAIITYQSAVASMRRAIEVKGENYVYMDEYDSCRYFGDSEPQCLIGWVLHDHGYTVDDLPEGRNSFIVSSVVAEGRVMVDSPQTVDMLECAQIIQDEHGTWGNAFRTAVSKYPEQHNN